MSDRFERDSVASGVHLAAVLVVLAFFPILLQVTHAGSLPGIPPASPEHAPATFRFCVVLVVYLWFLCLVTARGIHAAHRITVANMIGTIATVRAGLFRSALVVIAIFLAELAVGTVANVFAAHGGSSNAAMQGLKATTALEAVAFLVAAMSAGFVEEFVFRGYLQRQMQALTGNFWLASVLQIGVFTLGHIYQGWMRLLPVLLLGCVLTAAARLRKTLVPGMIAHALGDALLAFLYFAQMLRR